MRYLWISAIALGCAVQLSGIGTAQIRDTSVDELVTQLGDQGVEKRRDAAYELARRVESSDVAIAALGKATADDDTQVRVQSLTGLARAGKKSESVIPALIKCLSHREDQVRYRAASALGAIGPASIEPLQSSWSTASLESKIAIAQAIAIIGPAAKSAIPLLTEGLNEKGGLPRYAAEALVAIAPNDEASLLCISNNQDVTARRVGINRLAITESLSETAIKKLYYSVSDTDPKIRETAILAIAKSKLQIDEKATLIEMALIDNAESVRAAAIVSMLKARLPAEEFSQRIVARMQSADSNVANTLVKAISQLGPGAKSAMPAMIQVASKPGIDQMLVSRSLANFGADAVPKMLAAIESRPEDESVFSQALGFIGEPAVEPLNLGLSSPVVLVRLAAVRALGGMRPMSKSVLESVAHSFEDPSDRVREIAVMALIAVAREGDLKKDDGLKNTVLKATQDIAPNVRAVATQCLTVLKLSDEQITEVVDRGLQDAAPNVRASTLKALGSLPKFLRSRSDRFVAMISDSDGGVRKNAVSLLGKLDKKQVNEAIVAACVKALGDSENSVRLAATESVRELAIDDKAVLDALGGNLVDDLNLLTVTLEALSGFGGKAAAMIPAISQLARHKETAVRVAAINALSSIEKDPQQLIGRLIEALDDREWEVRQCAGIALGKMGPDAKNAVPKLFGMLKSDLDKGYADSSLKEINTAPVEAVSLLMEKIDSNDRREAFYAVSLLGKIGPPAAESLPKLEAKAAKLKEELTGKGRSGGDKTRDDFRRKFLAEAIEAIKGESVPK